MKIGVNYLEETVELVSNGMIDIDYYKFPSVSFQMQNYLLNSMKSFLKIMNSLDSRLPIILHGLNPSPQNICSKSFKKDVDIKAIKWIIEEYCLEHVSVHFCGAEKDISREELIIRTIDNINFLADRLNNKCIIAIENIESIEEPYYIDPNVINYIVSNSKAKLLLDISHAYVVSKKLNIYLYEYLDHLPLNDIYEIHINGWIENHNGILTHTIINEQSYEILRYVMNRCTPMYITIEYGCDHDYINCGCPIVSENNVNPIVKSEIVNQVNNIHKIIKEFKF